MCCSTWVFCSCPTELFIAVSLTSPGTGSSENKQQCTLWMCAAQLSVFTVGNKIVLCAPTVSCYYVHFMLGLYENLVSVDFSSCRAVWLRILSEANVQFKYCFMSRWVGNGTPSNFLQNINIIWLNGLWIYVKKKFHYMNTEGKGVSYNKWELSV